MRARISAIGLTTIGLIMIAAPALADTGMQTRRQNPNELTQASMLMDRNGSDDVVARGPSGLLFITNFSGESQSTSLTTDITTTKNGHSFRHYASDAVIGTNGRGDLTVVYSDSITRDGTPRPCDSQGLLRMTRIDGTWSAPAAIPGTYCQTATAIVVRGATVNLATRQVTQSGAASITFSTNATGSWTHARVADGIANGTPIGPASLTIYEKRAMLAYVKNGKVMYARSSTETGDFSHVVAATAGAGATSQPSVAIYDERPMVAWSQSDGTWYAYRAPNGWWYASRVMHGTVRALLSFGSDTASIVAADGAGGLWMATRNGSSWDEQQLDTHAVSDLAGFYLSEFTQDVWYLRGSSPHLYAAIRYSGC